MSFLDTLDGYVIPPQNNRQSHTLTSSSKPGEVSSTKTTRIKREAIVQSIRKAMDDDDDDDDLGDGDGNGDGDGDGDGEGEGEEVNVDGGKRLKREETPTRAITFISSDEPLTRLGTRLLSLVDPSATFPPQSDPIWAYDSIRSNYFADIDEDAVYDHLESTVISFSSSSSTSPTRSYYDTLAIVIGSVRCPMAGDSSILPCGRSNG